MFTNESRRNNSRFKNKFNNQPIQTIILIETNKWIVLIQRFYLLFYDEVNQYNLCLQTQNILPTKQIIFSVRLDLFIYPILTTTVSPDFYLTNRSFYFNLIDLSCAEDTKVKTSLYTVKISRQSKNVLGNVSILLNIVNDNNDIRLSMFCL